MKLLNKLALLSLVMKELHIKGSWCGETEIQKAVYFLQQLLEIPFGFSFVMYKQGPFSFDLRDELTAMRADGHLSLEVSSRVFGPKLVATSASEKLRTYFPITIGKYQNRIRFVAETFGSTGVEDLEKLASALYVTKLDGEIGNDVDGRAKEIHDLKSYIPFEVATQAVNDFDSIREKAQALLQAA